MYDVKRWLVYKCWFSKGIIFLHSLCTTSNMNNFLKKILCYDRYIPRWKPLFSQCEPMKSSTYVPIYNLMNCIVVYYGYSFKIHFWTVLTDFQLDFVFPEITMGRLKVKLNYLAQVYNTLEDIKLKLSLQQIVFTPSLHGIGNQVFFYQL